MHDHRTVLCWRPWWLRPQFRNEPQNLLEHLSGDGDLGHLEHDVAAVAHHLRPDLDQLLRQACQRPVLDRLGRRQRAQEIAEVVGERMKLEPNGIGGERPARHPRPLDRPLAFLDPLLARPALVAEGHDALGLARNTIIYVRAPVPTFEKFRRVVKPGGLAHAIESDWNLTAVEPLGSEWRALVGAASSARRIPEIGRQLYGFVRRAGFSTVAIQVLTKPDTEG